MKDGAAVHSDGAFAPSAPPPPHSRAAAQRSLRRTPRPSLTSPGDGSRRRTNLSRPLRSAVVRLGHGGARAGSGGGSGRPRRQRRRPGRGEGRGGLRGWGGVVEGARSPPRPGQHPADASPQGSVASGRTPPGLCPSCRSSVGVSPPAVRSRAPVVSLGSTGDRGACCVQTQSNFCACLGRS